MGKASGPLDATSRPETNGAGSWHKNLAVLTNNLHLGVRSPSDGDTRVRRRRLCTRTRTRAHALSYVPAPTSPLPPDVASPHAVKQRAPRVLARLEPEVGPSHTCPGKVTSAAHFFWRISECGNREKEDSKSLPVHQLGLRVRKGRPNGMADPRKFMEVSVSGERALNIWTRKKTLFMSNATLLDGSSPSEDSMTPVENKNLDLFLLWDHSGRVSLSEINEVCRGSGSWLL
ncbi:uncharacterized protein LOC123386800 [Felis catus]|uniref:uncharacterized protein LOC123386800 n=1 Tax=Felis catus TaxID=9685 RepID=UPI001D1A01A5|nr:uncharacterized protein LOC123386800 [Felis catus]